MFNFQTLFRFIGINLRTIVIQTRARTVKQAMRALQLLALALIKAAIMAYQSPNQELHSKNRFFFIIIFLFINSFHLL